MMKDGLASSPRISYRINQARQRESLLSIVSLYDPFSDQVPIVTMLPAR